MNLLILNYEYPPLGGGAGVISKYHAENLAKQGVRVTVLTTWFEGEKEVEEFERLKIIRLKSKRKFLYKSTPDEWISWIFKTKEFLRTYLKENKIDFCIANFALPSGEVARYLNRKYGLPYVVISHGQDIPWFFPQQMFKYHILTYFWIKNICVRATNLILQTQAMKRNADRFMRKYRNKNIIIPNGCDINMFNPDKTKKKDRFKIIFVGRLVEQKDPMTFLSAIKSVKKELGSDFEVSILGDGPLLKKMQRFVEKNMLNEIVQFRGWLTKEELLYEYQSSHLQVISSKAEAMSVAALESLSCGLYIISTPVSGNTDIIEKGINGDFFGIGNDYVLSQKIIDFYRSKFLNKFSVNDTFLETYRQKFDWENIVKELSNVINPK